MYAGNNLTKYADRPAFIMAATGEAVSHQELDERSNRLAQLLRAHGMQALDHYSVFMENNARYLEACGAGERSGYYYTCINSFLTADELAYILNHSQSQVLITSASKLEVAREALKQCPKITLTLVVDGAGLQLDNNEHDFVGTVAEYSAEPIADERLGSAMLYSSGTTGRPKGIIRPLPDQPPSEPLPIFHFLSQLWHCHSDMVYLSPAPLYHSAPLSSAAVALRHGGTVVIMERFDPVNYLSYIEQYKISHSQLVPTMFSRMLKLPEDQRTGYDLSSLEYITHGAAPCPVQIKQQMIEWWGPIIHEYYGATEGLGFAACNSEEWLAHPGTVGKVLFGELHVLDDDMNELPVGQAGTLWFKTASPFSYFNDEEKTRSANSEDGEMSTVGDVGYVDEDGFLYLTDRKTFMIISGGVNIYPQETENLLITHPLVADAAVFGVPNEDLGEEVKAVVELLPGVEPGDELAATLTEFCAENLSRQKVPRSIDFMEKLPRLPTGKLYKRVLRDPYWK
ncbi:MAG: AMP-binding protein [Pseudomonadota bacterium]